MTTAVTVVSLVPEPARDGVDPNKVITQWPDMLKVAGSLVTDQVPAYGLLRVFGREGRPTPLGAAFAEYGRIAKTEHLLRVVGPVDDTCRRQTNRQLTVQGPRHKPARDGRHGKRGTIHQAHRDGMEDQLGTLGPVLNTIVPWTTKYIDAAGALSPLRDPDAPELDGDDGGQEWVSGADRISP
nr:transposase [Streptomyces taklimakanensis]